MFISILISILIFIGSYKLEGILKSKEDLNPVNVKIEIYKYYDKDENMLCYYNNLGGMSCVWSMEDL